MNQLSPSSVPVSLLLNFISIAVYILSDAGKVEAGRGFGGGRGRGGGFRRGGGGGRFGNGGWGPVQNVPNQFYPNNQQNFNQKIPFSNEVTCSRPVFTDAYLEIDQCSGNNHFACHDINQGIPINWKAKMVCQRGSRLLKYSSWCTSDGNWAPQFPENCDQLFQLQNVKNEQEGYSNQQQQCKMLEIHLSKNFQLTCLTPGHWQESNEQCVQPEVPVNSGTKVFLRCKSPYTNPTNEDSEWICSNGKWEGSRRKMVCVYEYTTKKPEEVTTPPTPVPNYGWNPATDGNPIQHHQTTPPNYNYGWNQPSGANERQPPAVPSAQQQTPPNYGWIPNGESDERTNVPSPTPPTNPNYGNGWLPPTPTPAVIKQPTPAPYVPPPTPAKAPTTTPTPTALVPIAKPDSSDVFCPPLKQQSTGVQLQCIIGGSQVYGTTCEKWNVIGTEASYSCRQYYESNLSLKIFYRTCKKDGSWTGSSDSFNCVAQCGISNIIISPRITFGESTSRNQWPWHAAIFLRDKNGGWKLICGGTVVTSTSIITAAHCITLYQTRQTRDVDEIRVELGKFRREERDEYVQIMQVKAFDIYDSYDPFSFESDIGIIILRDEITFGYHVRPACFPQIPDSALEEQQLAVGSPGTVVGFGFDENGRLSDELKMASLKIVSQTECSNVNDGGSLTSINSRSTTFCAGLKNKTNVCNGDSGGGMVFPLKSEDTTRWYLQGIVSAGLSDGGKCDPEKYSVFTRVGRYASWITRTLSHYDVL